MALSPQGLQREYPLEDPAKMSLVHFVHNRHLQHTHRGLFAAYTSRSIGSIYIKVCLQHSW